MVYFNFLGFLYPNPCSIFQFFADNDDLPTARIKGNTDFKSMGALGGCTRIGGALEIHSRF